MKTTIVPIFAVGFCLAVFACAKKKEPVEVEPPPPPPPVKEQVYQPPPPPPPPKEDPLEAERRRLEELMNKIMADDIYFEFDQATLTSKARDILTEVGDILKRESRFTVLTEGHTDERGTENYNLGLGMRRAESVVKFLTDYGVGSNRLQKRSFGKEQPKADGQTEDAWAQNRRAAFRVQINN
ncbi:MAG: OmpA family protein [Fibromonadaceae bacterium]|jgi:peptidoglycan-associated lipoprotein|nr:OmpA family protein [Fibromonadaceae bacterium]